MKSNPALKVKYRCGAILLLTSGLLFGCCQIFMEKGGSNTMVLGEPETFSCEVSGSTVRIKYYRFGSGEPVLLLHGFGLSSYTWLKVAEALSKDHTVVIPDLKGFGLSDKPPDTRYSPLDQAEIFRRFILEQDLKGITVVGHSLGGAVALSTYDRLSEEKGRIKSIVLIDTYFQNPVLSLRMKMGTSPLVIGLGLRFLPAGLCTYIIMRGSYFDGSKITEETLRTYAHCLGLPGARHALAETVRKLFHDEPVDILKIASEIDVPVLIIWGDRDPVFPLENGEFLAQKIRGSRLEVVAECGHVPQEEKPAEIIKLLTDFLKPKD
jgi:pimeloyl-ACP methyl ester carboxylesterase